MLSPLPSGLGPVLYMPAGATGQWRIQFTRPDGTAADLTTATAIEFFLKRSAYQADGDTGVLRLSVGDGVSVVDALNGIVDIVISAARSALLENFGEMFYLAKATLPTEVLIPDYTRGSFYTDPSAALSQAIDGNQVVSLIQQQGNYVLNRHDRTHLYGADATALQSLSATTLAALADGSRIQLGLGNRIIAQYTLRAKAGGEVDTPGTGRIVVMTNANTRVLELEYVMKDGVPCSWDDASQTWCQVVGYNGAASLITPGFILPN